MQQVASAITWYYSKFSTYYSPFDKAFLDQTALPAEVISGFNVFMSKGQCATCHFVPTFSGLKPPFTNNEFEVIGVPEDKTFSQLSNDRGRSDIHDVPQMLHAFRTGSLRNNNRTKPYMHNGVFQSLDEVLDFYDAGGGLGKKIPLANQTLSADSLHLSSTEKKHLLAFLESLTEQIKFEDPPKQLPVSNNKKLNYRKVGGEY
jgi:cytochrome c peroxidase